MSIELNEAEQRAVDAGLEELRLVDPRSKSQDAQLPAADFETIQEIMEDEWRQKAVRQTALRNAAGRMIEAP